MHKVCANAHGGLNQNLVRKISILNNWVHIFLQKITVYISQMYIIHPAYINNHLHNFFQFVYRFNEALNKTRCVGSWKGRFGCLKETLMFDPVKCAWIIVFTAILHNFAMERGDIYIEQGQVINLNNDVEDRPAQIYNNRDVIQRNEGKFQCDQIARNQLDY